LFSFPVVVSGGSPRLPSSSRSPSLVPSYLDFFFFALSPQPFFGPLAHHLPLTKISEVSMMPEDRAARVGPSSRPAGEFSLLVLRTQAFIPCRLFFPTPPLPRFPSRGLFCPRVPCPHFSIFCLTSSQSNPVSRLPLMPQCSTVREP